MEFEAEHEGLTASWVAPAPQGGKGAEGRAGVADEAGHGKTEAECAEDGEKCGDAEMSALDRVQRDRWRFSSPPPHSGVTGKGAIPIKGDGKAIECQELTGEGEWLSRWGELPPEPRRSGNEHLDESRYAKQTERGSSTGKEEGDGMKQMGELAQQCEGGTYADLLVEAEQAVVHSVRALMLAERQNPNILGEHLNKKRVLVQRPRTILSVESENATMRSYMLVTLICSAKSLLLGSCMSFFAGMLVGRTADVKTPLWDTVCLLMAFCAGIVVGGVDSGEVESGETKSESN
ncbi:pp38 [Gallid alphaherpesvirus 2]|uniref:Pp38 n=2 Tax=Gallid alphaherpesvirus 2 TaxID=10390 RepID=Q86876_9ALPH|nr:pp38 [Gallid alphaherpesvirus 2]ABF72309.1 pp38 [Gallid alphaherpesvirus 2]AYC12175.1 RLORF14a [Gallid alphaherpesvirus 2]UOW63365.1 RLORF14a [Gallid alphaherpesvirus 2]UOW63537.1 RLORF14a [Gallid alphaherpesvirus 2]